MANQRQAATTTETTVTTATQATPSPPIIPNTAATEGYIVRPSLIITARSSELIEADIAPWIESLIGKANFVRLSLNP